MKHAWPAVRDVSFTVVRRNPDRDVAVTAEGGGVMSAPYPGVGIVY